MYGKVESMIKYKILLTY